MTAAVLISIILGWYVWMRSKKSPKKTQNTSNAASPEVVKQPLSPADAEWKRLNQEGLQHAKEHNWGLYTSTILDKAAFLKKEGKLKNSLSLYLFSCHLELNEPNNYGKLDKEMAKEYPPFGPKMGPLAPVTVDRVKALAKELGFDELGLKEYYSAQVIKQSKGISSILPFSIDTTWERLLVELNVPDVPKVPRKSKKQATA